MEQTGAAGAGTQGGSVLTTMEAAAALRLGYAATLAAIRRGDLPARKIGKSYRVRSEDLAALVAPVPALHAHVLRGGEAGGVGSGGGVRRPRDRPGPGGPGDDAARLRAAGGLVA